MHSIEPYLKNFLERAYTPHVLAIKLHNVTHAGYITIPLYYLKNFTSMFEHRFLPLINDRSFEYPSTSIGYVTIMP